MNTILMAVLLTLLGISLVAFLTWLGICLVKLMKFKKKAEGSFKHLERWVDDNNNQINKTVDENINEIYRVIEQYRAEFLADISNVDKKIDSRFDKLQENLKKEKLGLQQGERLPDPYLDLIYQLQKETQKNVELLMEPYQVLDKALKDTSKKNSSTIKIIE